MSIHHRLFSRIATGVLLSLIPVFAPCATIAFAHAFAQESPAKVLPQANVPGYKLNAIDFVSSPKMIGKDGKTAQAPAIFMLNLPFPRTAKPVTVYVRARPGNAQDEFVATSMEARERGQAKRLDTTRPTTAGQWQWVRLKPLTFAQVGERLRVDALIDKKISGQPLEVESIVISTRDDLDDATLASTPLLFPAGPVARVAKADVAPTLDGRDDDAIWKNAVAIEDFVNYNALRPAQEPTVARLTHDDKNLYVLFRNIEPLLKTADMRGSEMKTLTKTRDGDVVNGKLLHDVLSDDACMMLLQPSAGGPVYEFTVNAQGVMADAKMARSDLWATRDLSWNSNFQAAARQGDGFWTLEMAIPLTDIGAAPLRDGDRWQAALVRLAASRKESSSWNPSGVGAHRPQELGTLIFGEAKVGVTPDSPLQSLEPGRNSMMAQIALTSPANIRIISRIEPEDGKTSVQASTFAAQNGILAAQHQFDVTTTGTSATRWGVLDAATMQPIYLSPTIQVDVQSMSAKLRLSTPGAYQLVVNDQVVAQGDKAEARELQLPLRAGANVIALRADSGSATVTLVAPGLEHFDQAWRANDATTPQAISSQLDDRNWPLLKADENGTLQGTDKPTVFRRTILVNQTPVWPVPQPALYVAGRSTQHVSFLVKGLPGKSLERWTTYLAAPKELQVLGSTGFYGTTTVSQPMFSCEPAGQATIDGQSLPLYKISADKPLRDNRTPIMSIFQVMLKIADESQAKEGVSWKLHYWSQANDGTMLEAPCSFEVRALPPLNGRQPKKLSWELWGSYFHAMDSEPLRRATLETMQAAGINHLMAGNRWMADVGKEYGVASSKMVNFKSYSMDLAPYLKDHPAERLLDHKGKPDDTLMCTTLLVGENWSVAAPIMAALLQRDQPAMVTYDYEYSPLTGPHSCYCERCLTAFRERAKLGAEVKLTPRIIEDQHLAPWQDFMAYRAAQILAKMKGTVHQTLPGVPFGTYSLFQSPRTLAVYGIDWRYVGQLKAVDIAQAGLGRPLDDIRATYEALDGIPLMMGIWLTPYSPDDLAPARIATKAELLRRSLDATAGMLVYDRNPLDGRSWQAIAETTRLVAEFEDLFLAHKLVEIPGQDSAKVQLLQGENQSLLCVMNETSKPAKFNFRLPVELGAGREYYSRNNVVAGSEVEITLDAGEAAAYVLK